MLFPSETIGASRLHELLGTSRIETRLDTVGLSSVQLHKKRQQEMEGKKRQHTEAQEKKKKK